MTGGCEAALVGSLPEALVTAGSCSVALGHRSGERSGQPGALGWLGSRAMGTLSPHRVGVRTWDLVQVLQKVQLDSSRKQAIVEVSAPPPPSVACASGLLPEVSQAHGPSSGWGVISGPPGWPSLGGAGRLTASPRLWPCSGPTNAG